MNRLRLARLILPALLSLAFPVSARASALAIGGEVQAPVEFGLEQLQALPPTTVEVTFSGHHGEETAHFTGVLLRTLLDRAGLPEETGKNPNHLKRSIVAIGEDGYRVALAWGEIDPDFEGKQVIIAYARDGQPLGDAGPLRLIVPGDRKGGRDVRNLDRIELK